MWCNNCGKEHTDVSVCPDCGMELSPKPELSWGTSMPGELLKVWPRTEKGELERPAFLVHRGSAGMEDEMTVSLLGAYGIPALRKYPNDGDFGRIILGISGTGMDIYVPESMLEEARLFIEGENL